MAKRVWTAKMRADFRKRMVAAKIKRRSTGFKVGKKTGKPKAVSARKRRVSKLARSTVKTVRKPSRVSRGLAGVTKVKQRTKDQFIILVMNKHDQAMGYFTGETWDTERKLAYVFRDQALALRMAQDLVKHNVRAGWRIAVASNDFIVGETGHGYTRSYGFSGRSNPVPRGARVKQAAQLFEDFTGHAADSMDKVVWRVPDVAVQFGRLEGVMYSTVRDGRHEKYLHKFKQKSQPLLGASHDGKQLVIVGGRYQFTDAGIEDR